MMYLCIYHGYIFVQFQLQEHSGEAIIIAI